MKARPLKVYSVNFDGRYEHMVACKNQTQAIKLLDVLTYHFRLYGHETWNVAVVAKCLAKPGIVHRRCYKTYNAPIEEVK